MYGLQLFIALLKGIVVQFNIFNVSILYLSINYSGIDINSLENLGVPETLLKYLRGEIGYVGITYGLYKIATPARYAVTLGGTTISISYLKEKGYIKPVPTKDELKEMIEDKKEELIDKLEDKREEYIDKKEEVKEKYLEKKDEFKEKMIERKDQWKEKYENIKESSSRRKKDS